MGMLMGILMGMGVLMGMRLGNGSDAFDALHATSQKYSESVQKVYITVKYAIQRHIRAIQADLTMCRRYR